MTKVAATFLILVTILIWCFYGDLNMDVAKYFTEGGADTLEKAGQWGDSFGAFTALMSALGTIGVVWTLLLQQRSIRDQAADLHRQRFESTFFQLLSLLKEAKAQIRFTHSDAYLKGKYPKMSAAAIATFKKSSYDITALIQARAEVQWWIEEERDLGPMLPSTLGEIFVSKVFKRFSGRLSSYYRIIYSILKKIDNDKILTDPEKIEYSKLVRAQLTNDETQLLALNGLSPISGDLHGLISKYRMLKYINNTFTRVVFAGAYADFVFEARD